MGGREGRGCHLSSGVPYDLWTASAAATAGRKPQATLPRGRCPRPVPLTFPLSAAGEMGCETLSRTQQ